MMKRYGEEFNVNDDLKLWETISSYMDDDIREDLNAEIAPCEPNVFLCAYLYRDSDFWEILRKEFGIVYEDKEVIATLINASGEWIYELCEKLIEMADFEDESAQLKEQWQASEANDGKDFEALLLKAAKILNVVIITYADGTTNLD